MESACCDMTARTRVDMTCSGYLTPSQIAFSEVTRGASESATTAIQTDDACGVRQSMGLGLGL
jgi:hypothetical protein